jgi:hypothetical protein
MPIIGGVVRDAISHGPLWNATVCITGTLNCYSTDGSGLWNNASDGFSTGYSGVNVTATAGGHYAKSVNMNTVAYYPDAGANGLWEVIELDRSIETTTTCFTGVTKITMADGSVRSIELIEVGDWVRGANGRDNRVIGIEKPLLGRRWLYSVNRTEPFVTAEHPLLTTEGWKAIDPAATAAENAQLAVGQLAVGDQLLVARVRVAAQVGKVTPHGSIAVAERDDDLEIVPLLSLRQWERDPSTPLYNLLLDGDHTYFANGLVVHNKH